MGVVSSMIDAAAASAFETGVSTLHVACFASASNRAACQHHTALCKRRKGRHAGRDIPTLSGQTFRMMTAATEPEFVSSGGNAIALRRVEGAGPVILWLGGFRSDMRGGKAERLAAFAAREGRAFIRFDYSGHGESGGRFEQGTISRWRDDAAAVIACHAPQGPLLLVGSSMGAWIALLLARTLGLEAGRLMGMVLLAPAPDFTTDLMQPRLTQRERDALARDGFFSVPSAYAPEPTIYTRALFEDGAENRVMTGLIETRCPVAILQGMADPDVPHTHALKLVSHLPLENVTLTLIKDGDHRLSREQDLALLERTVSRMLDDHDSARPAPNA
jgi:pimeloyl-ACP methyl ester carboxylesterase